jgi:hypothetical protein
MSKKYTKEFLKHQKNEIIKANMVPEYDDIMSDLKSKFMDIEVALQKTLFEWQNLAGYIKKTYPSFMHESKMELAGMTHYNKVNKNKLEFFENMEHDSVEFIKQHEKELVKAGMPIEFIEKYNNVINNYKNILADFFKLKKLKQDTKKNKIDTNNTVYKSTIKMCEDGKTIFADNPDIKKYFTYNQLIKIVRGRDNNIRLINIGANDAIKIDNFITFTKIQNIGITQLKVSKATKEDFYESETIIIEPGDTRMVEISSHSIIVKNLHERISGEFKIKILKLPELIAVKNFY